jgi:hypothetical protein
VPRVQVIADPEAPAQQSGRLLDERVSSIHITDRSSALQLIERIGWAIDEAERVEHARQRSG